MLRREILGAQGHRNKCRWAFGVEIVDDVLLDPDTPATGKEVVPWMPKSRVVAKRFERLPDQSLGDRRLLLAPVLPSLQRDVLEIVISFGSNANSNPTGRHRASVGRLKIRLLRPAIDVCHVLWLELDEFAPARLL